jgi:hypothetical protein
VAIKNIKPRIRPGGPGPAVPAGSNLDSLKAWSIIKVILDDLKPAHERFIKFQVAWKGDRSNCSGRAATGALPVIVGPGDETQILTTCPWPERL